MRVSSRKWRRKARAERSERPIDRDQELISASFKCFGSFLLCPTENHHWFFILALVFHKYHLLHSSFTRFLSTFYTCLRFWVILFEILLITRRCFQWSVLQFSSLHYKKSLIFTSNFKFAHSYAHAPLQIVKSLFLPKMAIYLTIFSSSKCRTIWKPPRPLPTRPSSDTWVLLPHRYGNGISSILIDPENERIYEIWTKRGGFYFRLNFERDRKQYWIQNHAW